MGIDLDLAALTPTLTLTLTLSTRLVRTPGPSAGVTMLCAIFSLVTGRPVRPGIAFTGELSLRGHVLPVGGIKEKLIAAHVSGIRTVVIPKRNLLEANKCIADEHMHDMRLVPVSFADDVLAEAFDGVPLAENTRDDDTHTPWLSSSKL